MPSDAKISILFLGATGYIGGSVLARLLEHSSSSSFDITALVRAEDKAKLLEASFGIKSVVGSMDDHDLIEKLSREAHVLFSIVNSDDLPGIEAVLRGLKKRHEETGGIPILIHTSGTGVLITDARGETTSDSRYDDMDVEKIESLPPFALHRNVDLAVTAADKEGYAKTYIVVPGTIYGIAAHRLVEAGISNPHSVQVPIMVMIAMARGQAGMVGRGLSMWPNISIQDTADLFLVLFDKIFAGSDEAAHGREGYYFGENGEHTWFELSQAIGEALTDIGVLKDKNVTTFSTQELIRYAGSELVGYFFGSDCKCKASRARLLGWEPKHTRDDFLKSIKPEVIALTSDPSAFTRLQAKFAERTK